MKNKVLICDDDAGILEVVTLVLEEEGFEVKALNNSADIFTEIDTFNPDVILLDLWMPVLTGEQILVTLKQDEDKKDIPVIIFSASRDTEEVAEQIGADAFLFKPFDIDEIISLINKFIK